MATAGAGPGAGPERAYAPSLGERVVLDAAESAHLVRARRVREGEAVVLFDGRGGTVRGVLEEARKDGAVVRVLGPYPDREPARALQVATALPEPGRVDGLVARLAELGVARLAWLAPARGRPDRAALPARRAGRWARLAREAAKSCGRSRLLVVDGATTEPAAFLAREDGPFCLLDPDPAAPPLGAVLAASGPLPWVLVGPEGGWSPQEREEAGARGVATARLGATALRVDTAAIVAAGVLATVA